MSCPEAKAYMSVLLSNPKVAKAVVVLNDAINRQKILIENAKISGATEKSLKSKQSLLTRYEARLDAYVFSLWLNNTATKQAFLDSAKKAWTSVRQAAWLLETLDESYDDIVSAINNWLDDANKISKQKLSEWIQKYITNNKYYENLFSKENEKAVVDELSLLWYSDNDYLLLKTFYTKELEDIVGWAQKFETWVEVESIYSKASDVKSQFILWYAPYRSWDISDVSKVEFDKLPKNYKQFLNKSKEFAKLLWIEIKQSDWTIWVYWPTSDSREISNFTIANGSEKDIITYAALLWTLAPDIQHSVLVWKYWEWANIQITINWVKDAEETIQSLQSLWIQWLTYNPSNKSIVLVDVFDEFTKEQLDFISTLIKDGKIEWTDFYQLEAKLIEETVYWWILRESLNEKMNEEWGWFLRDAIVYAEEKYRRWTVSYKENLAKQQEKVKQKVINYIELNKDKYWLSDWVETIQNPKVDEKLSQEIADEYDKVKEYKSEWTTEEYNKSVEDSYKALATEVNEQYDYLTKNIWIKIEFIKDDPYQNSEEMFEDILINKRLKIFQWWEPNEFMSYVDETWLSVNEKFRAVHDFFWHFIDWNQFGKNWEEWAWIAHSKMFSENARWALTLETRWQNSWVNSPWKNDEAISLFSKWKSLIDNWRISEWKALQKKWWDIFQYAEQKTWLLPKKMIDYSRYIDYSNNTKQLQESWITSLKQLNTLQELEDYVIQNLTLLHTDEWFYRKVKEHKEMLLARDSSNIEPQTEQEKIDYAFWWNEASLISEIIRKAKPFEQVKIDDYTWFTMRLKALWYWTIWRAEYDKVAWDLFSILDWTKKKITINWNEISEKDYLVVAKILWLDNIWKRTGIEVQDISNIKSESIRTQLVYYAAKWDKKAFDELLKNEFRKTWIDYADENSLLSSLTFAKVDFSNWYVFFDWNAERLKWASEDVIKNQETYEARYLENQIAVWEVEKADDFDSLEGLLNVGSDNIADRKKVIIVSDLNLLKWNKLLDFVKKQNEIIEARNRLLKPWDTPEPLVVVVASDVAWQNFSYWYRDWNLTVRAKDWYKFQEMKDNITVFSDKYSVVDIPEDEISEAKALIEWNNLQNEKIYDLANLWSTNVNMADMRNTYKTKEEDDILEDVKAYAKSVWYDISNAKLWTNTDIDRLRRNYFAFSYSETLEQKFEALNNLLSHFWINRTSDIDNHFVVASLIKMLKEDGYDIPLVWVKDLVDTYIQKWEISPQFKAAFATNNYKKLESEWKSVDTVIEEKILPRIDSAPKSSSLKDVKIDITSTDKNVIINWDYEYTNSIASIFKWDTSDLSSLTRDLQTFNDEFEKILSWFDAETREWISLGKSKKELDTIRFKYRQQIDILEYKFNRQYGKLFDKWELYGRKFNLVWVYKTEDLWLLDEIVWTVKADIDNNIAKVENKINNLQTTGSFTENWYWIVDVWWKKVVTWIDDAIIEETKKLSPSSDFKDLRYVTREWLEKLSTKDKSDILKYLREENTILTANSSFLERLYSWSIYLNNIDFFNTYKLVDWAYWPIPEPLTEKLIKYPWDWNEVIFNKFNEDELKARIFRRVSWLVKKNTEKIDENIEKINTAIEEEINIFTDEFVAPKKFPTEESINYWPAFRKRVAAIMNPMFAPYAHLKPISKETIDRYKKIYQTKSWNVNSVLWEYLHKTEKFEYFESDNILSDAYKNQQKILLNRVEKGLWLIPEISESMIYINRKIFDFYGRSIAKRNERTNIVLNAQDALRTKWDRAVVWLRSVFSIWHSAIDQFIDPTIFNVNTLWFDVNRLAKIQSKVEWFVNMSDLQFNNAVKNAQDSDEVISLDVAEYYREMRRRLWTDWNGKWVTTDGRVNNAMHNLHKSFTEMDLKWDIKTVLNELKWYMWAIDSDNIFAWLNTKYFKNKSNPEYIWDIWNDIILENSNWNVKSKTLWAETFVTASEEQIINWRDTFNRLFSSNFSKEEFSVLSQNITWVKRVSKFAWFSWYNLKKASKWIPPVVKKSLQFWQNIITSVTSFPWYINNIMTWSNRHSYDELKFARDFRHIVWFWTEIVDSWTLSRWLSWWSDMWKIAEDIVNEKWLSLEVAIERAIWETETSYSHFMKWDIAWWVNSVLNNIKEKIDNIKKPFRSKTFETATLNWQNVSDIVMSWPLKDIAIMDAIKNNWYRSFHSVPSLLLTLQRVSKEEADKIIAEIRWQAVRSYNAMAGTAFGAADTPVNPYTWWKWWVADWLFAIQDNMSYLNWWWLAVFRNFWKMLEQTTRMITWLWTWKLTIDDAVNFIRSTPEYKATLDMIKRDLVNAVRVARMNRSDEEWDKQLSDITLSDIYEWLSVISTTLIGSQTVWVLRPWFASLEASLSDTWFTAKEAFFGSLVQNMFSNLTVPAAALTMLENFWKLWIVETLSLMIEEAWWRWAKFMAGTYARWWEIFVPWPKERWIPFILWWWNQDINTKGYYDMQSKARNFKISDSDSKFFSALSSIIEDWRLWRFWKSLLRIWEWAVRKITEWSYAKEALRNELQKKDFIETIQDFDIVKEKNTNQPFKIRSWDDLYIIEREFFWNNIWSNSMSLSKIVDKIDTYNSEWTILNEYSNTYDYATEELFRLAWKEKLEQIKQWAIAIDAQKVKEENKLTRQYIEQEFQKIIDSTDEDKFSWYRRVWWAMQETARDINWVKFEWWDLDKRQQKIDLYNKYMWKRTEQNREVMDWVFYQILWNRHWKEINKRLWRDIYTKSDDGKYWRMEDYSSKAFVKQHFDLIEAVNRWNFAEAKSQMNVIWSSFFVDNPAEALATAKAIWRWLNRVDESPLFSEKEKIAIKVETVADNHKTIFDNLKALEDAWYDIKDIAWDYLFTMFKLESEIDSSLANMSEDVDTWKWKWWWGWGSKFKWIKLDFGNLWKYKEKISDWLDWFRQYKLDLFKPSKVDVSKSYREKKMDSQYPLSMSAKTKTPSWFTKQDLKPRKDINRNIKKKKAKIPK